MEWISKRDNLYYGTRMDRIKISKDSGRDDSIRKSFVDGLEKLVTECKDVGMSRGDVEEIVGKVVDKVFVEE